MRSVKSTYVGIMHSVAKQAPFERLIAEAGTASAFGWRRWAASLLAIHDVRCMIGLDLPWWNVEATHETEEYLKARPKARIFEYGAGASTAWLARRAGSVFSVEHDEKWQAMLEPALAGFGNVEIRRRALDDNGYVRAIDEVNGQFDMVVIDGRLRANCLARALPRLASDGIVLFDDSGRRRYRKAITDCGLQERRYFGRSYCVPYPDFTSILHA